MIIHPQQQPHSFVAVSNSFTVQPNNMTSQKIEAVGVRTNQVMAVAVQQQRISIQATGKIVKVDCNPIARYNHAIQCYNRPFNKIQGIQLTSICCLSIVSWIYDCLIYFYLYFFNTITCQHQNSGWLWTLIMVAIYVAFLIAPIVSVITFGISSIFFLYWVAGFIVFCYNQKKLAGYQFTTRMVHASNAPPFDGYDNQFFEINANNCRAFYAQTNKMQYYQQLRAKYEGKFMAYKQTFIDKNYTYIRSAKMIGFHITMMILTILGLIISVSAFPTVYGRK